MKTGGELNQSTSQDKEDAMTLATGLGKGFTSKEFGEYIEDYFKNPTEYEIDVDSEYYDAIEAAWGQIADEARIPVWQKVTVEASPIFKEYSKMKTGGKVEDNYEKMVDKLEKEFEGKDLWDDEILDEYEVKQFENDRDISIEIEKFVNLKKKKFYVVPYDYNDDSYYYILVPKNKMKTGGSVGNNEKIIGKTKSGKNIYSNANSKNHDSFSIQDHQDAKNANAKRMREVNKKEPHVFRDYSHKGDEILPAEKLFDYLIKYTNERKSEMWYSPVTIKRTIESGEIDNPKIQNLAKDYYEIRSEYYDAQRQISKHSYIQKKLKSKKEEMKKGGGIWREFYEGQSIILKPTNNPKLDKSVKKVFDKFDNKELVIEKIQPNKPYNKAKVYIRNSGEKAPFDVILNPKYVEQYANGGGLANTPESFPSNDAISYKTGGKVDSYYEKMVKNNWENIAYTWETGGKKVPNSISSVDAEEFLNDLDSNFCTLNEKEQANAISKFKNAFKSVKVTKMANGGGLANVPESFPETDAMSYAEGGGVDELKWVKRGDMYFANGKNKYDIVKGLNSYTLNVNGKAKSKGGLNVMKSVAIDLEKGKMEMGGLTKGFEYTIGGL